MARRLYRFLAGTSRSGGTDGTAWLEHLCEHCGIVRVGAAGPFPAPYLYSVTFVRRGGFAEIIGFDHPKIAPSDFELVITTINKATGILVAYDRAGPSPIRVVQIDPGLIKGKIRMQHEHKHRAVAEAKNPDGSVNQTTVVMHSLEACIAILGGALTIVEASEVADASNPKRRTFTFTADVA